MREMPNTFYRYADAAGVELVVTRHDGPGARVYPQHTHARHWTLGVVCRGALTVGDGAGRRTLGRGGVFVIPPETAHTLKLAENTVLAVLCADLRAGWRNAACSMANAARSQTAHWPWGGAAVAEGLEKLLQQCARLAAQPTGVLGDTSANAQAMRPIENVARLLREQPETAFSLDVMAHMAGFSPWYFLRLFRRHTGLTPHAYQLDCRLRRLRGLLRAGTAAADAALAAGFSDQSHMQRIFKRHHAITPMQFRRASVRVA